MAKLGHPGYGLYLVEGTMFIVSPAKAEVMPEKSWLFELETILDASDEERTWIDHKINRSLLLDAINQDQYIRIQLS